MSVENPLAPNHFIRQLVRDDVAAVGVTVDPGQSDAALLAEALVQVEPARVARRAAVAAA